MVDLSMKGMDLYHLLSSPEQPEEEKGNELYILLPLCKKKAKKKNTQKKKKKKKKGMATLEVLLNVSPNKLLVY